ncbi:hypothetical protein G7Y89_g2212 [Cudoniella acicularis]|uniref:Cytochrome P450 n=1 Tax=Cudoniella acicularis TaxID=354080 RepID=A0A8H4RTR1_9HELO|nr:hypothetical protein G7Y89_g2212 [Cudoniella acicularis]
MAIVVAGSEILTTALASSIHFLLQNPESFKILLEEVHSSFSSEEQITSASTTSLPYLNAVLNETLRMAPPFPGGLHREVPKGGAIIAGYAIPEGMTVSVPCWSMFPSASNFTSPDIFVPERWLKDADSKLESEQVEMGDKKEAFHPFSLGPHGCIGQPLAWMEMRLILSRLL